ncbi:MAG: glycosyltransferase family 4 protein [Planctomycetes bacterium]|nr:glycosyltransferase family 4 protein [Planctomycetia bacterium]MBI3467557.1 glycosyltransferase family 4 protein [Planctomycetota bacterium]
MRSPALGTGPPRAVFSAVVLHTRVVTKTGGGPEKTILNSPRFLGGRGYRVLCAFMHPPEDPGFDVLRRRAAQLEAPIVSIPDRGFWDLGVVRKMLKVCRSEGVTIWHAHDYKSNALGLLLRRLWPMRLVTTVHGWVGHTRRTRLYYAIDRWCLRRYERVICVSEELHKTCLDFGVAADKCLLVENAIDTAQCVRWRSRAEAKQELGLSAQRPLIGACGRLSEEKGFDRLIVAVDKLLSEGSDVQLVILGEGDDRTRLQDLVDRLDRRDRIMLPGHFADVSPWYEAMDVFALSSLREGLPNVLLEALAWEVPCVATDVGGVSSVIQDGQNGLLLPAGDVPSLAAGLRRLLSDQELQRRLAAEGRETIQRRYSFAHRMERIGRIYDSLVEPKVASCIST